MAQDREHRLQELAGRLVANEVYYSVSQLVGELLKRSGEPGSIMDEDDAFTLCVRRADASDYNDAAPDDLRIGQDGGSFKWKDGHSTWSPPFDSALDAWRDAFEALELDHPDGADVYEHWLISDWLAAKLEAQGESVVRDMCGLTIWGRCVSGQAIALDRVVQQIALDAYGDPDCGGA